MTPSPYHSDLMDGIEAHQRAGGRVPAWVFDWVEHALARAGVAIVSREIAALAKDIDARLDAGLPVPPQHIEAVLYAVYAGPYGDYHQAKVFA
jgi:hypothetical protein